MSWTSTSWKYTDGDYAPVPVNSEQLYIFNINDVGLSWSFTDSTVAPIPITSQPLYIFNIDDVALFWKFVPESNYLPCPPINPLICGSFANCAKLQIVTIPPSVKKLGMYSFYGTSITDVTISSDCIYYDSTFPENCTIHFYN